MKSFFALNDVAQHSSDHKNKPLRKLAYTAGSHLRIVTLCSKAWSCNTSVKLLTEGRSIGKAALPPETKLLDL